jgi:hypothetical protein
VGNVDLAETILSGVLFALSPTFPVGNVDGGDPPVTTFRLWIQDPGTW